MSPILDIQRRGRQLGEIRLGAVVRPEKGKPYPTSLDSFRFTTKSPSIAQAVAQLLGGEARAVTLQSGTKTHEVFTDVTELPVMVPPGDNVISQWYEMWSKAGCQRRCDGETEQRTQEPCMCPSDPEQRRKLATTGGACKPTTRVNLMLPDLPDLGVWLLSSGGFNAANELGGAAEVLAAARNSGVILPATLRLEHREVRVVDEKPKKFVVPVLELNTSLRQMTQLGTSGGIASALPPPPPQAAAALGTGAVPQDHDDEPAEAELVDSLPGTPDSGGDLLNGLEDDDRRQVRERIANANFPTPLPPAAERQVRRWVDEIKAVRAKEAPF